MKKQLLAIAALLSFGAANAQNYYHFPKTGTLAPYSSLATATVVVPQGSDEFLSPAQTIPFSWNFFGNAVTSYKVSDNGYITFDASEATSVSANVALPSASAPKNAIFAFWDDIEFKAISGSGVKTEARTFTYGTAPNRVHVIQWFTASKKGTAAGGTNYLYFAIRLFEGGVFDIVYNDASPSVTGLGATIGCQNADGTIGYNLAGPAADFPNKLGSQENATDKVYNFKYGNQPDNDVAIESLNLPKYEVINNNISIKGQIMNYGKANLSSFRLFYSVNGGAPASMLLSGLSVNTLSSYNFTHNIPYSTPTGTTANIAVWASLPNNSADGDSSNNFATGSIFIASKSTPRRVLHEVFTSSTCPPCKPGNEVLHEVLNQKVGEFAVLKYQYYFPGAGDPYFTLEAYNRATYYGGVNSVPNMMVDGGWADNPGGYTTGIFDNFRQTLSFVEMTSKITTTGNKADVTVDVKPLGQMPAGTYKLYIALVEKNTSRNVKTNGEINFEFVMKKMLPNETGQAFTFPAADQTKTVNASFTFPGNYKLASSARVSSTGLPTGTNYAGIDITKEHSVEKFYDLHVVAFIVREETKEVMQSTWSAQDWAIGQNELEKTLEMTVYPNPNNGNFELKLPENVNNGIVTVRDINGRLILTQDINANNTAIQLEDVSNGIYFVELSANGKTTIQKMNIIR